MKVGGGKTWFTAAELAALGLPGLSRAKRKINERAAAERWALREGPDGAPLARPRLGARGGGLEYHLSVLPAAARAAIAAMGVGAAADIRATPESASAALWRRFEASSDKVRAEAERRLRILDAAEQLEALGFTATAAVATVAQREGIGQSTLWDWRELAAGAAATDRLPALAPRRQGGGRECDVDPGLWEVIRSDYLRPEKPTFSSVYHRVRREYAEPRGIAMPGERTLRRKLERDVDPRVVVLLREGEDALRRTLPPQQRSVAALHALELVNIDGHRWDVFARWPDGTVARPVMIAIQDVMSRKLLAWSIGKTESAVETRLALAHLLRRYGVPRGILLDNGRAFASKWITGGSASRFRFKIRPEEPLGIVTALHINPHWAQPYRGQSKPIERAFRDLCDHVAKRPEFAGAYTGNRPDAKPENYGSTAVPIARFVEVAEAGIAAHNALEGRDTEMARGIHSFDQVFADSYAVAPIGKATPEQLRLALLAADDRPTDRNSGAIALFGNRYWSAPLAAIAGERVTVRFDPDDLHAPLHVYRPDGAYLCSAPVLEAEGFLDVAAAKRRARLEKDLRKSVKELVRAEQLLDADRIARLYEAQDREAPLPEPGVIRPVRRRGNTAAAIKPDAMRQARERTEAERCASTDLWAAGVRRLRAVT